MPELVHMNLMFEAIQPTLKELNYLLKVLVLLMVTWNYQKVPETPNLWN